MKPLKGTKTHDNLKAAFAGESQANRRYLYFANKADVEGQNDVSALFRSTAEGETGHAHGHLDYLKQVGDPATDLPIGDTTDNLKAAIAGETHEYTDMYPGMAKAAREEGFTEIADMAAHIGIDLWHAELPMLRQDDGHDIHRAYGPRGTKSLKVAYDAPFYQAFVNRDLPLDFTKPLPFNDQYRHFGKGQMEAVLDFPPGTYTLRLLLADHKHIPFFIYSKPMTITVTAKNDKVDPKSLTKPGVELLAPRDGELLTPPFRVQFHASGLNVSHTAITDAGVGHFRLVAQSRGGAAERIAFTNGVTEAWLKPPAGEYTLKLELVANAGGAVMASSAPVAVKVSR